jgi:hypothetical protein
MSASLTAGQDSFYNDFTTQFFSAGDRLMVTEEQRQEAIALCHQASKAAALACMTAFGATDFRDDLPKVSVPALVLHGDSDQTVPFEGPGRRTHEAIAGSDLYLIADARTGATSARRGLQPGPTAVPGGLTGTVGWRHGGGPGRVSAWPPPRPGPRAPGGYGW